MLSIQCCCSQDQPIDYILMNCNLKMEERMLCDKCYQQHQYSGQAIKFEEGKLIVDMYCKKLVGNLDNYLQQIFDKLSSIQSYVEQQKSDLTSILDQLLKNIEQWIQSLIQVVNINKNEHDFLDILDSTRKNDDDWLKDCQLRITYQIQQFVYSYYHKIDQNLKKYQEQLMNFKLAEKVIEISRLCQEKCWNDYIDVSSLKKKQLKEKFQDIYCLDHNRKADTINIQSQGSISNRIQCKECQQPGLDINQFIQKWDQIQQQKIIQQQQAQNYIQGCYEQSLLKLEQLRNTQYRNLSNMIDSVFNQFVDGSKCFERVYLQSHDYNIQEFQEMAKLCSQTQQQQEIQTISCFRLLLYKQGKDMVQDVKQILLNSKKQDQNQNSMKKEQLQVNDVVFSNMKNESYTIIKNVIKLQEGLINEIYAMAFNKNGSLLVTGGYSEISVFLFSSGTIKFLAQQKCLSCISALQFGSNSNQFLSGHTDGSLNFWHCYSNCIVNKNHYENLHQENIRYLISNYQENELISSGDDSVIKIYSLDFQKSTLQFLYSLKKHEKKVTSISLNQSQSTLLSCSQDGKIIVWKKNRFNEWQFQYFLTHSIRKFGKKIVFIRDDQFIWTQKQDNIIITFEEKKQQFILKNKSSIKKPQKQILSPYIHNKQKNIIFLMHLGTIFLAKQQNNGEFNIVAEIDNQSTNRQQGAVTNDCQYLVIWEENKNQFLVFNLYL